MDQYLLFRQGSDEANAAFDRTVYEFNRASSVRITLLFLTCVIAFWVPASFAFSESPLILQSFRSWTIAGLVVGAVVVPAILIFRAPPVPTYGLGVCVVFGSIGYSITILGGLDLPWFYAAYLLPFATLTVMTGLTVRIVFNLLVVASFLIGFFAPRPQHLDFEYVAQPFMLLFVAMLCSSLLGHVYYYLSYTAFMHKRSLMEKTDALHAAIDRESAQRQQLEEALAAAQAAERAKSEFLAMMSHEIRTPMNAVVGMTSLLSDTPLTSEQQEFALTIRRSSDSLLAIINDILDFSKIEAGGLELEQHAFDLRECVDTAVDLVAGKAAEKGIELVCVIEEGAPRVLVGDSTRIRQVLINLLNNAVKFTEQGEVVLTVSADPASTAESAPATLRFEIKDTGIGIPAERMNRLFKPFSQADASTTRRYGGTGLGLVISQRLCTMMRGGIRVQSDGIPGRGASFTASIVAETSAGVPNRSEVEHETWRRKRLLVVDDNPTNRRLLVLQTRRWNMIPTEAGSGAEALELLRSDAGFDLAVLDFQMPEMDGIQLALEIRQLSGCAELPLILMSSLGERGEGEGASEFLTILSKPITQIRLYEALARIFGGADAAARAVAAPRESVFDATLGSRHPLRILLAEDNAINQLIALRLLERMGYAVDVAATGLEVLEALRRQPYDVVLMDMMMPEMDGVEASKAIVEELPATKRPLIIAMTANATREHRDECLGAGMSDFVSKPIRVKELQAALVRASEARSPAAGSAQGPQETASEPEVLDESQLRGYLEFLGTENIGTIEQLISGYRTGGCALIAGLRQAVAASDSEDLLRKAHIFKGQSGAVGAQRVQQRCADLERHACGGAGEGLESHLAELEREFEHSCRALSDAWERIDAASRLVSCVRNV